MTTGDTLLLNSMNPIAVSRDGWNPPHQSGNDVALVRVVEADLSNSGKNPVYHKVRIEYWIYLVLI